MKFTNFEKEQGSLAVRDMSKKAFEVFSTLDMAVYKYVDNEETTKAEQKAEASGIDFFPGDLDIVRYAINNDGDITLDLSFEDVEKLLEDIWETWIRDEDLVEKIIDEAETTIASWTDDRQKQIVDIDGLAASYISDWWREEYNLTEAEINAISEMVIDFFKD